VAAFELSERTHLPLALSAKDLLGGQTQVLNVHPIRRIDHHPSKHDTESAPESISDTGNWLNWNGDLDNPNKSEDDCEADNGSEKASWSGLKDSKCPECHVVRAALNVPRLIWPTQQSMQQSETGLVTVCATETKKNKGPKKTLD
jgi:hypothetical protein